MASILEPRPSSTDVVCGALSEDLNQNRGILDILAIPLVKGSEELKTIAGRRERWREQGGREGGWEERERGEEEGERKGGREGRKKEVLARALSPLLKVGSPLRVYLHRPARAVNWRLLIHVFTAVKSLQEGREGREGGREGGRVGGRVKKLFFGMSTCIPPLHAALPWREAHLLWGARV